MGQTIQVANLFAGLGLKVDKAAWDRGSKAIDSVRSGLGKIAKWGAVSAAAVGIGAIGISDGFTELENRIRQVSGSTVEMNTLMDRTREIANATRSDWKSTGEAFVRLKNSTKDLNLSTAQQLDLVETLNMALQSSGASATEASAGTLQLMQGLSAGALQGDEFRSIAEQLPDLMDVFAKELKVSRGELKKLGAAGKITSKVVVSALQNSSASIRDKFTSSTATAAQQWVVLKNNLTLAAGEFIRSTGIVDRMGNVLGKITKWVEANREGIRSFGKAVGEAFSYVAGVVGAVIPVVVDVFNWLTSGSDAAVAVLIGVASVITAIVVPALISMALGWIVAFGPVVLAIAAVAAISYGVMKLIRNWDAVKHAVGRAIDWIIDKVSDAGSWIAGVAATIASPFIAAFEAVRSAVASVVNWITGKINWVTDKVGWIVDKAAGLTGSGSFVSETLAKAKAAEAARSAPSLSGSAAAVGSRNTTVNAPATITINGAGDPSAVAAEVTRQQRAMWNSQMRLNEDL